MVCGRGDGGAGLFSYSWHSMVKQTKTFTRDQLIFLAHSARIAFYVKCASSLRQVKTRGGLEFGSLDFGVCLAPLEYLGMFDNTLSPRNFNEDSVDSAQVAICRKNGLCRFVPLTFLVLV
jgi:hypothetical protein